MNLDYWKKKKKTYEEILEMHDNKSIIGADKLILDRKYIEKQLATVNRIIERHQTK